MGGDWVQLFLDDRIRKGLKTEKHSSLGEYRTVLHTIRNKFGLELDRASIEEINSALVQMRMRYAFRYLAFLTMSPPSISYSCSQFTMAAWH